MKCWTLHRFIASSLHRFIATVAQLWLLPIERYTEVLGLLAWRFTLPHWWKDDHTIVLRGSKSRPKVSVGEPAERSLSICYRCFGRGRNDAISGCSADMGARLACCWLPSRAENFRLPRPLVFSRLPVRRCIAPLSWRESRKAVIQLSRSLAFG